MPILKPREELDEGQRLAKGLLVLSVISVLLVWLPLTLWVVYR